MRQRLGNFRAALAVFGKLELGGKEGGVGFNESVLLAHHDFFWDRLAVVFLKRRFVVEEVKLTRRATHEEINHAFGFGLEMRLFWRQRIDSSRPNPRTERLVVSEKRSKG